MGIKDVTTQEKMFLDQQVRKAKKELFRQRKLGLLINKSAWESIPIYCEVEVFDEDTGKVTVEDEYGIKRVWDLEEFIEKHIPWEGLI